MGGKATVGRGRVEIKFNHTAADNGQESRR
jgi:hypothetical protein